ncbi:acyl-CoA thioesterase domain-containing protein [Streptomyces sp. NPDC005356]|uniref:acyl-CoA thioesterase n=1 Tax=Streptomyces sp. NPDC005356 TaxID=3157167 RepID=UPI0033AD916E
MSLIEGADHSAVPSFPRHEPEGGDPRVFRRIAAMLQLERIAPDLYTAHNDTETNPGRLYGGLVAAQALAAAQETVPDGFFVNSLHSVFLRPGRPGVPVRMRVDRMRDGVSFLSRQVEAEQDGKVLLSATVSFHRDAEGPEFAAQMPVAPHPDDPDAGWIAPPFPDFPVRHAFRMREQHVEGQGESVGRRYWIRPALDPPDGRALHSRLLAFASDFGALSVAARAIGLPDRDPERRATLDHTLWFHRPARFDDWLLIELHTASVAGTRGLVLGTVHDRSGRHVATIAQEALLKPARPKGNSGHGSASGR